MEKHISGQIAYEGVSHPKSVQRFVEKRISRWVDSLISQARDTKSFEVAASALSTAELPEFEVKLQREGKGHAIRCYLKVKVGETVWVGQQLGENLHQAVDQCLHALAR